MPSAGKWHHVAQGNSWECGKHQTGSSLSPLHDDWACGVVWAVLCCVKGWGERGGQGCIWEQPSADLCTGGSPVLASICSQVNLWTVSLPGQLSRGWQHLRTLCGYLICLTSIRKVQLFERVLLFALRLTCHIQSPLPEVWLLVDAVSKISGGFLLWVI